MMLQGETSFSLHITNNRKFDFGYNQSFTFILTNNLCAQKYKFICEKSDFQISVAWHV